MDANVESMEAAAMRRDAVNLEDNESFHGAVVDLVEKLDIDENRQAMQVPFVWGGRVWIGHSWGCLECMYEREGDDEYEGGGSKPPLPPRKDPPLGMMLYRSPGQSERYTCASCDRTCHRVEEGGAMTFSFDRSYRVNRGGNLSAVIGYVPEGVELSADVRNAAEGWWFEDVVRSLTSVDLVDEYHG